MAHFRITSAIILREISLPVLFLLAAAGTHAQHLSGPPTEFNELKHEVESGNSGSLYLLGDYLDSSRVVFDPLGHHYGESALKNVARRIISENTLFSEDEVSFDDSLSTEEFHHFINDHLDNIRFSSLSHAFLITPESARKPVRYELRHITPAKQKEVDVFRQSLEISREKDSSELSFLLRAHDPLVLLHLGCMVFRHRSRWNTYYFDQENYTNLVALLTGLEVFVGDARGKLIADIEHSYSSGAELNYMTYWAQHYGDYAWSEEQQKFVNSKDLPLPFDKHYAMLTALNSRVDSIAFEAFFALAESDTTGLMVLLDDPPGGDLNNNDLLPTFHLRFIRQLAFLADYCRRNGIAYNHIPEVDLYIKGLRQEQSTASRYALENEIIQSLTLDEVAAFEYAALGYANDGSGLIFSAGRILDIFYSAHWRELLADKKHLAAYLKKITLFGRLGIVGMCNNYAVKFWRMEPAVLKAAAAFAAEKNDADIKQAFEEIETVQRKSPGRGKRSLTFEADRDYVFPHFRDTIIQCGRELQEAGTSDKKHSIGIRLGVALSSISYAQIPDAIAALKTIPDSVYDKTEFLKTDFGIGPEGDGDTALSRFLKIYYALSESELYAYYLRLGGKNIRDSRGSLDFSMIYQRLKYDNAEAFAGGGMNVGRNDNIYPVIKLMELYFKTTLGFSKKFCHSRGNSFCGCEERSAAWIAFLRKKGKIRPSDTDPPSFNVGFQDE